jgi:2-C-methyl-D-erythritol 2,4-cyclodiphosphate synthase
VLLAEVAARVRAHGGRIVNVDATVVAEAPRLAGYLEPMRKRLGETLDVAVERISVKAKHAERLGALGRQEGVAAMAVALVEVARA